MDIAEILKNAKPPEATVELCLDANLTAEHDDLERQLLEAKQEEAAAGRKMGDAVRSTDLARKIVEVEERMRSSVVTFRMRGLSNYRYQEWLEANPPPEGSGKRFNPVTALPTLIAACCVDPKMTEDDAVQLVEAIGVGQADPLFSTALQVTEGRGAVPFSVAASVTLRGSEQKPK